MRGMSTLMRRVRREQPRDRSCALCVWCAVTKDTRWVSDVIICVIAVISRWRAYGGNDNRVVTLVTISVGMSDRW